MLDKKAKREAKRKRESEWKLYDDIKEKDPKQYEYLKESER